MEYNGRKQQVKEDVVVELEHCFVVWGRCSFDYCADCAQASKQSYLISDLSDCMSKPASVTKSLTYDPNDDHHCCKWDI